MAALPNIITVRVIAGIVGASPVRVQRLLDSRPDLQPKAMADSVAVYDHKAIAGVRHEINLEDAVAADTAEKGGTQ